MIGKEVQARVDTELVVSPVDLEADGKINEFALRNCEESNADKSLALWTYPEWNQWFVTKTVR